jgi:ferrochelatase
MAEFRSTPNVVFTAHSVPLTMTSSSPYVNQLRETAGLIGSALQLPEWRLVYQSRSGPPGQPWLEPDILDYIRELSDAGEKDLVIVPIGFISDHMEVVYDLDTEARNLCEELGLRMVRAATVGTHPDFVRMIRDQLTMPCQVCEPDCCPRPQRPAQVASKP